MTETCETLCPFCGAYSPRQCEMFEDFDGVCPWEESQDDEADGEHSPKEPSEESRLRENEGF